MAERPLRDYLADNPHLVQQLAVPRLPRLYVPHRPTVRQAAFLNLWHLEALFGGAAGGGKSDALLMGACQYVHVPGYAALILRRSLAEAAESQAILARAMEWWAGTDVVWRGNTAHFPSGASISFGYLRTYMDCYRYQSAEYQYIAFDELTQFFQDDYEYLFSRLRRPRCPHHVPPRPPDLERCLDCIRVAALSRVPLRMRAATNPGGPGHSWVRRRFDIRRVTTPDGRVAWLGHNPDRPYLPATIVDNPHLDQESYIRSLSRMDPITREQLLRGDWTISADGRIKSHWARYYTVEGNAVFLDGRAVRIDECWCFQTVDPAASSREGPGDPHIWRRPPSWTVVSTWLVTPTGDLVWWDVLRFQREVPETIAAIIDNYRRHTASGLRIDFIGIESGGLGIGVYQMLCRAGLPVRPLYPRSQDKLVRATDFINRFEQGRVWLPQSAPWLEDLEAEMYNWTGDPKGQTDQIDTAAYAALVVSSHAAGVGIASYQDLPAAWA